MRVEVNRILHALPDGRSRRVVGAIDAPSARLPLRHREVAEEAVAVARQGWRSFGHLEHQLSRVLADLFALRVEVEMRRVESSGLRRDKRRVARAARGGDELDGRPDLERAVVAALRVRRSAFAAAAALGTAVVQTHRSRAASRARRTARTGVGLAAATAIAPTRSITAGAIANRAAATAATAAGATRAAAADAILSILTTRAAAAAAATAGHIGVRPLVIAHGARAAAGSVGRRCGTRRRLDGDISEDDNPAHTPAVTATGAGASRIAIAGKCAA